MRRFTTALGACAAFVACGGAPDSPLLGGDASSADASTSDATTTSDAPNDSDGSNNCAVTCATIPDGFHAARLSDGSPCPTNWTSTSVVSAPIAGAGTCTCGCNVTQAPSCEGGNIVRNADVSQTAACDLGVTTIAASATCASLGVELELSYYHYQVNPPPAQGGACEFDVATDSSKVTSTPGLVCQPPDNCVGAICGGDVCVAQTGDVACPTTFPTKTLVGNSASAQCGACGGTCTPQTTCGGTLKLFEDAQCTIGEVDQTADGSCGANPNINAGPFYYSEFVPSPTTPTCAGSPTAPTATASLDSPTTVCCH